MFHDKRSQVNRRMSLQTWRDYRKQRDLDFRLPEPIECGNYSTILKCEYTVPHSLIMLNKTKLNTVLYAQIEYYIIYIIYILFCAMIRLVKLCHRFVIIIGLMIFIFKVICYECLLQFREVVTYQAVMAPAVFQVRDLVQFYFLIFFFSRKSIDKKQLLTKYIHNL